MNGTIPGPTVIVDEGDVVEFEVTNRGTVPHGMSIHAASTQTSKYLGKILPGETRRFLFRATVPGVYLYHCAPGGHAIMMHTMFGQYGMMVVRPRRPYRLEALLGRPPDVEIFLLQHEIYANGADAIGGRPLYVLFNGELFRYVRQPIVARPGDYVRIFYLNAGANHVATFHIVGIVWDFAYWQGHPDNVFVGGQSVTAGPTDSWVVEFRAPPDERYYTIVDHAFGSTDRGAVGYLHVTRAAPRTSRVLAEGPRVAPAQWDSVRRSAVRVVATFEPGTDDVDPPVVAAPTDSLVRVRMIGNSFVPKVLHISAGTTVEWINEDAFVHAEGEYGGIHNVVVYRGPETPSSPPLHHAGRFRWTFRRPGVYEVMCGPHPYMRARIVVTAPPRSGWWPWVLALSVGAGVLVVAAIWAWRRRTFR